MRRSLGRLQGDRVDSSKDSWTRKESEVEVGMDYSTSLKGGVRARSSEQMKILVEAAWVVGPGSFFWPAHLPCQFLSVIEKNCLRIFFC